MIGYTVHAINESAFAVSIRESQSAYPLLQVVHIIGISLFAGGMIFANLRVAGVGQRVPLVDFVRYCTRTALFGLALVLVAGLSMYASFAEVFYVSTVMRTKLALLLLAFANLTILVRGSRGDNPRWHDAAPDPQRARKWATLGIAICLSLITLGKLLAYIGGKD